MILRSGTKGTNVLVLAKKILKIATHKIWRNIAWKILLVFLELVRLKHFNYWYY